MYVTVEILVDIRLVKRDTALAARNAPKAGRSRKHHGNLVAIGIRKKALRSVSATSLLEVGASVRV